MTTGASTTPGSPRWPGAARVLLSWLAMIAVDLALHGGLLAPLYAWDSPFLLAPIDAFIRIPAGYAALLVLAAGLSWLLEQLEVRDARRGAAVAGAAALVVWGAMLLGIWSISTASPVLLLGWWLGQSLELALGGALLGAMLGGVPAGRLAPWVAAGCVGAVVTAVVLQSIGYASAPIILGAPGTTWWR